MDEELRSTAAATLTGTGVGVSADDDGEEARILSNLLQSLSSGAGSGPVSNMMRAMGQDLPLVTTEEDQG